MQASSLICRTVRLSNKAFALKTTRIVGRISVFNFHTVKSTPRPLYVARKDAAERFRSFAVLVETLDLLGESNTKAELLLWNKRPGDTIVEGDVIAAVKTEIRAKKAGVFVEGMVSAQGEISVGAPLYKMDTSAASPKVTYTAMLSVPYMGYFTPSGWLYSYEVKVGDIVEAKQLVAFIETPKILVEIFAPAAGKIIKIFAAVDEKVYVGQPIVELDYTDSASSTSLVRDSVV